MVTLTEERFHLLTDILKNPKPRWRVWQELTPHGLTAAQVVELIDAAMRDGRIHEHDGVLYISVRRHKDIR